MITQPDFEELLRLLEAHDVEYMIVGGYAVAYHGYPRFTYDMDIFYNPTVDNVGRLRSALMEFGFTESDLSPEVFLERGNILMFGVEPARVDMLNDIAGVEYTAAAEHTVRGRYGGVTVSYIGYEDLLKNKLSTGRSKDILDAQELG